jgi:hypothetical protein
MNQSSQRRRGRGSGRGHPLNVNKSDTINRAGRSNNNPRSTAQGANTKKNDKNHGYTKSTSTSTSTAATSNLPSSFVSKKTKKKRTKTKRFRKMKVLRMWVLPTLFLIPLCIILIEYYIGKIISLDDIQDVYVEQTHDPWELLLMDIDKMSDTTTEDYYPDNNINNNHNADAAVVSSSNSLNIVGSLPNISYAVRSKCPQGLRRMINVHNPMSHSNYRQEKQKRYHIPMIVHQQSKTRCLTMNVDRYVFTFFYYMIYEITIAIAIAIKFSDCGM